MVKNPSFLIFLFYYSFLFFISAVLLVRSEKIIKIGQHEHEKFLSENLSLDIIIILPPIDNLDSVRNTLYSVNKMHRKLVSVKSSILVQNQTHFCGRNTPFFKNTRYSYRIVQKSSLNQSFDKCFVKAQLKNLASDFAMVLDFYSIDNSHFNSKDWIYLTLNSNNFEGLSNDIIALFDQCENINGNLVCPPNPCESEFACSLNGVCHSYGKYGKKCEISSLSESLPSYKRLRRSKMWYSQQSGWKFQCYFVVQQELITDAISDIDASKFYPGNQSDFLTVKSGYGSDSISFDFINHFFQDETFDYPIFKFEASAEAKRIELSSCFINENFIDQVVNASSLGISAKQRMISIKDLNSYCPAVLIPLQYTHFYSFSMMFSTSPTEVAQSIFAQWHGSNNPLLFIDNQSGSKRCDALLSYQDASRVYIRVRTGYSLYMSKRIIQV